MGHLILSLTWGVVYPKSGLFIVHNRFDTLLYADLAEGKRTGRNSAAVDTARDKRLHIIRALSALQILNYLFITCQLDIPAQQHIAEPHQGIEPVDRQQQKAERLPQVISAPQMGLLMGNDILPAAAVHVVGKIDLRADCPKHER